MNRLKILTKSVKKTLNKNSILMNVQTSPVKQMKVRKNMNKLNKLLQIILCQYLFAINPNIKKN